jgi:hypothetical protein
MLNNGDRARIFSMDGRLYLEIGGPRRAMVRVAGGSLASRDSTVTLRYTVKGKDTRIPVGLSAATAPGRPATGAI